MMAFIRGTDWLERVIGTLYILFVLAWLLAVMHFALGFGAKDPNNGYRMAPITAPGLSA